MAHKELAPATLMATYEFAARRRPAPPLKLVWHQGDSKPPGWVPAWGGRSWLFIGDKGMLLGNGKLLPEEKFKDFQTPPETLPRSPGHWVEWVNYAKGNGPVPGSNFQYSGLDDRSESPRQRRLPDGQEDRVGLREPARDERAGSRPIHQAARVPQRLGRHPEDADVKRSQRDSERALRASHATGASRRSGERGASGVRGATPLG